MSARRIPGLTVLGCLVLMAALFASPAFAQTDVDVEILKGNQPDLVAYPGDVTTYTITMINNSTSVPADDLEFIDDLPEDGLGNSIFGTPFNVSNTHGVYSYDAGTNMITVSDVDLGPGESMTLSYDVVVVTPFEGDYTNTATVTFPPAWVFDSNTANNTASYVLSVLEPLKFPAKSSVQALVACRNESDQYHLIAGQMNGPILRSVPDGVFLGNRRWSTSVSGLPAENLVVNDLYVEQNATTGVADQVFAAVWGYDGLYRTEDCGRTWSVVDFPGMAQDTDPFKIVYAITRGPGGPAGYILYASADRGRIFRSLDRGVTWDMTMSLPAGSADTPFALAADPNVEGALYAGTFGNGIFRSYDYGELWERAGNANIPGEGGMHIFDLKFDPEATAGGHPATIWAATAEGVFLTQDQGDSWAERSNGLEITGNNGVTFVTKETRAITFAQPNTVDPRFEYSLFAAVWGAGIFKKDGDRYYTDWEGILLRNLDASALLVHNGALMVGTNGQGLFEVELSASSTANEYQDTEIPEGFVLQQNYPNPFNPTTSISFELPEATAVKLSVFDVLGREVAVLANGKLSAGSHAVTFDAAGFQSGMYIYQLETANYTLTRSMVLMK
ncbi:MAG: T9SS type A sorting domain-containing protein [Rhodothermales bacterium]|nr:T9SS type A sorting domain-containing protein [Rhodothermales bacterium]